VGRPKRQAMQSVFGLEQRLPDGALRVVLSEITVHGVTYGSHQDRDMVSPDGRVVSGACRTVVGTPQEGFLLYGADPTNPLMTEPIEDFKLAKLAASDDCYEAICLAELAQPAE